MKLGPLKLVLQVLLVFLGIFFFTWKPGYSFPIWIWGSAAALLHYGTSMYIQLIYRNSTFFKQIRLTIIATVSVNVLEKNKIAGFFLSVISVLSSTFPHSQWETSSYLRSMDMAVGFSSLSSFLILCMVPLDVPLWLFLLDFRTGPVKNKVAVLCISGRLSCKGKIFC